MKDIKQYTLTELKTELAALNEPAYRAEQIFSWLYKKGISNFQEMTYLPQALLHKLSREFHIGKIQLAEQLTAKDKTEKFLFQLADNNFIESVLIPSKNRNTLCLSTQAGCKYSCPFCASGRLGFKRNLTAAEIVSQPLFLKHRLKDAITNYVFMGMGEPLDNFANTAQAIKIMNDPKGLNIGARRITVSTCGLVPGIKKLKQLNLQINLSISLHAATNKLRDALVPVNKKYPLEKLIAACQDYIAFANRIITLEYILIKSINDSRQDAVALAKIAKRLNAKINLIPCSTTVAIKFAPPPNKEIVFFAAEIAKHWRLVTIRRSQGQEIQAACGQLAGRALT